MPVGLDRLKDRPFLDTDPDGLHVAVDRKVQEAFLHAGGHVLDQGHRGFGLADVRRGRTGPQPAFPVFDIKVIAVGGQAHGRVGGVGEIAFRADRDGGTVRPEDDGEAGGGTDLLVLALRETLVFHRIYAVVGVGRREDLADQVQVGSFRVHILHLVGCPLGHQGEADEKGCKQREGLFHTIGFNLYKFSKKRKNTR